MCSKFLTSSVDSTTSFHSNSFDSVDEENSASSQVDALLSASFELEEKVVSISNSLHMEKQQNKETEKKFQKLSAKYIKVKKEKELLASATKENICMSKEMKQLKKNNEFVNKSLLEKNAKLGKINTRNVNKRLKKRDVTIKKLKKEIVEKDKELARLKKINSSLIKSSKHKSAREASLRTKVWYWKKRAKPNVELIDSSKRDLEGHIRFLENENVKLLDQINESSKRRKLSFFENGQYTHNIRMVYEDLLCMGLSTRKIDKSVRLILEKLANVEVGSLRLPKVTFAKDKCLEARALSQSQLVLVLTENTDDNLTLHSAGTSKHGHSYTTLDVKKGDDVLVVGSREVAGNDAQSKLDLFKEILDEIEVNQKKRIYYESYYKY